VHPTHTIHAVPELHLAAGRLRDDSSPKPSIESQA
jgi:hypothetical protein